MNHLNDGGVATLPLTLASVTESCATQTNPIFNDRLTLTARVIQTIIHQSVTVQLPRDV